MTLLTLKLVSLSGKHLSILLQLIGRQRKLSA